MKHESQAKEPEASGGLCAVAPHAVRVGEAGADQPATSEIKDVTAGETAPIQVLHERTTQIGPVAVTFRFGRIK